MLIQSVTCTVAYVQITHTAIEYCGTGSSEGDQWFVNVTTTRMEGLRRRDDQCSKISGLS